MEDTKVDVKVPEKKEDAKLAKHIRHFKYYNVMPLKYGKPFDSDMHIIKSE